VVAADLVDVGDVGLQCLADAEAGGQQQRDEGVLPGPPLLGGVEESACFHGGQPVDLAIVLRDAWSTSGDRI
jgi:hypothetical protein